MPSPSSHEQPVQQAPPVQRLRVRYAKRGRLRFTSHRDFGRAFERAVQRAAVPIAFSSGYSPHPRISYAGASPTGAASEAEYLEIALARRCEPEQIRVALDAALPDGLDVLEVVVAGPESLADRLEASQWRIRLPGVEEDQVRTAVHDFLGAPSVQVQRMTKKGLRTFDTRQAVVSLTVGSASATTSEGERPCAILDLVVRHGSPSVRPDDVLAGLREVAGLAASEAPQVTRTAQGPIDLQTGTVGDPLAADRDAF